MGRRLCFSTITYSHSEFTPLDRIDIGANIGGYTMFTAGALGRSTVAIDCYMPNIERIARAVQIQRDQNQLSNQHGSDGFNQ